MKQLSIVKKVLMALTGLAWFAFLVAHLAGNFLLFRGPEAFNAYADVLKGTAPLLYVAEALLVAFLLVHAVSGIRVTLENRRARPVGYARSETAGEATLYSRTMALGGVIILVFIVVHVAMFKYGSLEGVNNGLWGLVVDTFKNPIWVVAYTVALIAIGMHLSHGIASALQTLGLHRPTWRRGLRLSGYVVGWSIAGGFIALPIWCWLYATN